MYNDISIYGFYYKANKYVNRIWDYFVFGMLFSIKFILDFGLFFVY